MIQIRETVDEIGHNTRISLDRKVIDRPAERRERTDETDLSGGGSPIDDDQRCRNICQDRQYTQESFVVEKKTENDRCRNKEIRQPSGSDVVDGKQIPGDADDIHDDGPVSFEKIGSDCHHQHRYDLIDQDRFLVFPG